MRTDPAVYAVYGSNGIVGTHNNATRPNARANYWPERFCRKRSLRTQTVLPDRYHVSMSPHRTPSLDIGLPLLSSFFISTLKRILAMSGCRVLNRRNGLQEKAVCFSN